MANKVNVKYVFSGLFAYYNSQILLLFHGHWLKSV